MTKSWDVSKVLELTVQPGLKCAGKKKDGEGCGNPISKSSIKEASTLVDFLSSIDPSSDKFDENLKKLAQLVLCKGQHQNQMTIVVGGWKGSINEEEKKQQENDKVKEKTDGLAKETKTSYEDSYAMKDPNSIADIQFKIGRENVISFAQPNFMNQNGMPIGVYYSAQQPDLHVFPARETTQSWEPTLSAFRFGARQSDSAVNREQDARFSGQTPQTRQNYHGPTNVQASEDEAVNQGRTILETGLQQAEAETAMFREFREFMEWSRNHGVTNPIVANKPRATPIQSARFEPSPPDTNSSSTDSSPLQEQSEERSSASSSLYTQAPSPPHHRPHHQQVQRPNGDAYVPYRPAPAPEMAHTSAPTPQARIPDIDPFVIFVQTHGRRPTPEEYNNLFHSSTATTTTTTTTGAHKSQHRINHNNDSQVHYPSINNTTAAEDVRQYTRPSPMHTVRVQNPNSLPISLESPYQWSPPHASCAELFNLSPLNSDTNPNPSPQSPDFYPESSLSSSSRAEQDSQRVGAEELWNIVDGDVNDGVRDLRNMARESPAPRNGIGGNDDGVDDQAPEVVCGPIIESMETTENGNEEEDRMSFLHGLRRIFSRAFGLISAMLAHLSTLVALALILMVLYEKIYGEQPCFASAESSCMSWIESMEREMKE